MGLTAQLPKNESYLNRNGMPFAFSAPERNTYEQLKKDSRVELPP
jgi:hypothetical protein